jgi:hypothetical protein
LSEQIIVSINVHEKIDYFWNQIDNINRYLVVDHKIVANANDHMFRELRGWDGTAIELHPKILNKRRFRGSIAQGIVSNMRLALERFDFGHFLVMSSRDFFYRTLSDSRHIEEHLVAGGSREYSRKDWHWPRFRKSRLHKHLESEGMLINSSPHEGLCLNQDTCRSVVEFLDAHKDIEEDIFNFNWCMEEFAIQSLCSNFGGFYYIGNGVWEVKDELLNPKKFTRKRPR